MNPLNAVLKIKKNSALSISIFMKMIQRVVISKKVPDSMLKINADVLLMEKLVMDTAPLY
jgi:hypothetical protein